MLLLLHVQRRSVDVHILFSDAILMRYDIKGLSLTMLGLHTLWSTSRRILVLIFSLYCWLYHEDERSSGEKCWKYDGEPEGTLVAGRVVIRERAATLTISLCWWRAANELREAKTFSSLVLIPGKSKWKLHGKCNMFFSEITSMLLYFGRNISNDFYKEYSLLANFTESS